MLAALALGLAIGLAVGTLGGGGSVLAVPVLVYLFDEPVAAATTASLMIVAAGAVAGGIAHARRRRVCWRHAISFTLAAVPGVAAGTALAHGADDRLLLGAFAAIMLAAAHATWRKSGRPDPHEEDSWEGGGTCPPLRLPRDALAGAGVGLLTGFLGVGGGFLIVPTLAVGLAFTMRTAVGTSLIIITATSLLGLGAHLLAGRDFDSGLTLAMSAGCVAGSIAGAAVADRMPQPALARAFALMVVAVAAYLVVSISVLDGPA